MCAVCLRVDRSYSSLYLNIYLSALDHKEEGLSVHLSVSFPSIYLSVRVFIYLFIYLFVPISADVIFHVFFCLSVSVKLATSCLGADSKILKQTALALCYAATE